MLAIEFERGVFCSNLARFKSVPENALKMYSFIEHVYLNKTVDWYASSSIGELYESYENKIYQFITCGSIIFIFFAKSRMNRLSS